MGRDDCLDFQHVPGALAAGEAMATELGDDGFAKQCRIILDRGNKTMVRELFDGEYFIQKPLQETNIQAGEHLNTNIGCHIDQVLGQSWMHQVNLGRIIPKQETVSALENLWKYNFAPDAGGYALKHREIEQSFRWYAMEGEAGLLMTTWPKDGVKDALPGDKLRPIENPDVLHLRYNHTNSRHPSLPQKAGAPTRKQSPASTDRFEVGTLAIKNTDAGVCRSAKQGQNFNKWATHSSSTKDGRWPIGD